jgi:hypothetical protein
MALKAFSIKDRHGEQGGVNRHHVLLWTLLPLMVVSPEAVTLMSPEPVTEMSLPLMVMVPSFFITKVAAPTVIDNSSPAVMMYFFPTSVDFSALRVIQCDRTLTGSRSSQL